MNESFLLTRLYYKIKSRPINIFYLLLLISFIAGIYPVAETSQQSLVKSLLYNNGYMVLFIPLLCLILYSDIFPIIYSNASMKRILMEPISNKVLFLSILLFVIITSFAITLFSTIIPYSIIYPFNRPMISSDLIRALATAIPLFFYVMLFSLIFINVSMRLKSTSASYLISFIVFFFLLFFYSSLTSTLNTYLIFPLFNINSSSLVAGQMVNVESYLNPIYSLGNSQYALLQPLVIGYNPFTNIVNSFTGQTSTIWNSFIISNIILLPLYVYVLIMVLVTFFGIKKMERIY